LIKPTAIHTPFPENAKNYLPYEPQLPPPLYAPELVAQAILHSAANPVRDFFVGGMAKAHSSMALNTPRLFEKMNEMVIDSMQNSGEPTLTNRSDGLYETNSKLRERGTKDRFVLEGSLYQRAKIHPLLTTALAIGGGVAVAALIGSRKTKTRENGEYRFTAGRSLTAGDKKQIRKKMEVVGSDGQHVGTVDNIKGNQIKLTRNDSPDGQHHFISADLIESITGQKVILTLTAEQAHNRWQSEDAMNQNESGDAARNDKARAATGF
jgi:hypothetical protein